MGQKTLFTALRRTNQEDHLVLLSIYRQPEMLHLPAFYWFLDMYFQNFENAYNHLMVSLTLRKYTAKIIN